MKNIRIAMLILLLSGFTVTGLMAQNQSVFNRHEVFDPNFMNSPGTAYRSGSGAPGPMYWQNRADYTIHAALNPGTATITGTDDITYTNNSPNNLHFVWLQLDQNVYKKDSRGSETMGPFLPDSDYTKGYVLSSVKVTQNGKTFQADFLISDTRMQIRLPHTLMAKGGKIRISIQYSYKVSARFMRTGYIESKNGRIYDIAQWYPRMCVYDDVRGWDTLPYLGSGEFYLEYGNLDYYVTVPWNMIVVGSGELQNPRQVLTKEEIQRLDRARSSDKTIAIIKADEIGKRDMRPVHSGTLTWHFKILNARDASWSASKAFIWDAVRINLPSGKKALAQAAYPVESARKDSWDRAAEFVKGTIEYDSKQWYEYPWPNAVVVADHGGGMEYPGIVFVGRDYTNARLYDVITHEFGHNWFPMLVGSNERRYPFMDEGFNTFIDILSTKYFNNDEFGKYAIWVNDPQKLVPELNGEKDPIMTRPDASNEVGLIAYNKPGLGLDILRDYILGHNRFDYAFRTYIRRWAYKHPTPKDFFRTMNDASGEDLNWFWKEWFYKTWHLDQAVDYVKYINGKPIDGALITISNEDKMVMPVTIKVVESNGHVGDKKLPVEIWQRGGKWSFKYPSTSMIDSVIVDPNHQLPDVNLKNNVWTSGVTIRRRRRR